MKGKGIKQERETIIAFNEADPSASVWTASESVYRRLKKQGYEPIENNERSARFEIPKRDIKLPRPKSEKRSQIARRRAEASKNAIFSSGDPSRTIVEPPNVSVKG